jgi:FkbM family methyltransferase
MLLDAPTQVKLAVKTLARRFNVDVRRLSSATDATVALQAGIARRGIDLVFDVGANVGQFGRELRRAGYRGRIVSFEPLPEAHARLAGTAASDRLWDVHPRTALGEIDGEIEINLAANSASSSVLPMTERHLGAAEHSRYVGRVSSPIRTLDAVSGPYMASARGVALKIDTQGYEWQVLAGASSTLADVSGILCELSLLSLYDGQRLWLDVLGHLEHEGFTLWSLHPSFSDPRDGRTLQVDAVLFRA